MFINMNEYVQNQRKCQKHNFGIFVRKCGKSCTSKSDPRFQGVNRHDN